MSKVRGHVERRLTILYDWDARFGTTEGEKAEIDELENQLTELELHEHIEHRNRAETRRAFRGVRRKA